MTEEIRGHADRMTTDQTNELELDEAYDSAEDEDFELDAAGQDESEISSSEGEGEENSVQPAKKKRKTGPRGKKETRDKAEDEELDSGDEVTIQKAKKNKAVEDEDDDEGGTGGFVRTRAMKMRTYVPLCFTSCDLRRLMKNTDKKSENLWPRLTAQLWT